MSPGWRGTPRRKLLQGGAEGTDRSSGGPPKLPLRVGTRECRKPITGIADCCARAASGHAAAQPRSVMNARRFIRSARRRGRQRESERPPRHISSHRRNIDSILIVPAYPLHREFEEILIAAFGHKVEELVGTVDHVNAPPVTRIGVEHLTSLI